MKTLPVAPALTTVGTEKAVHSPEATVRVSDGSVSTYPACDAASALRLTHPRQQYHAGFCNRSARKLLRVVGS